MILLFVLRTLVSAFNPRKGDLTTFFLWNWVGHLPTMSSFKHQTSIIVGKALTFSWLPVAKECNLDKVQIGPTTVSSCLTAFTHTLAMPLQRHAQAISTIGFLDRDNFCLYNESYSIASATWSLVESFWGKARQESRALWIRRVSIGLGSSFYLRSPRIPV